jgi:hypothetical protein
MVAVSHPALNSSEVSRRLPLQKNGPDAKDLRTGGSVEEIH